MKLREILSAKIYDIMITMLIGELVSYEINRDRNKTKIYKNK